MAHVIQVSAMQVCFFDNHLIYRKVAVPTFCKLNLGNLPKLLFKLELTFAQTSMCQCWPRDSLTGLREGGIDVEVEI